MPSRRVAVVLLALAIAACEHAPKSPSGPGETPDPNPSNPGRGSLSNITVGRNEAFTRIQAALDAAASGATIVVLAGTYGERITITKPVKLEGRQAVMDGLAAGLDGRHIGIDVRADRVEITGFTIQNYERGVVVQSAYNFRFHRNEVRNNLSKDPPPISAGVTKSDGVILSNVQDSIVSDNFIHDNGSIGLSLGGGSGGNSVFGNRVENNGTQQGLPGSGFSGGGIITGGANNTRNEIFDNDVSGGYWGIRIGSSPDSANVVRNNRVQGAYRAGIAVWGQHNIIEGNIVSGSGSLNMPPSCDLDLMDLRELDNTWRDNVGKFGSTGPDPFNDNACR
jgi:hypothetical protein